MIYKDLIQKLEDNGFEAYIVGGAVRDIISGKKPQDYDLVTSAKPEEVIDIFKELDPDLVGVNFNVVMVDGIEIASFRKDVYRNSELIVEQAETLDEDLKRRDFTINSIAMTKDGKILDPLNVSDDIVNKTIRFVGNPKDRILEDPVRMIRACRFAASIDGFFDTDTLLALDLNAQYIDLVPKERIRLELLKAMKIKKASKFFKALFASGLMEYIIPELLVAFDHPHGKHHNEYIFDHLMICGDEISTKCPLTKLAGYLHDIGKPDVAYFEDNTFKFKGHDKVGAKIVSGILFNLKFSTKEIEYISNLIENHMRTVNPDTSSKSIRKILRILYESNIPVENWLRLKIADRKANLAKENLTLYQQKEVLRKIDTELCHKDRVSGVKSLMINGNDVMRILDIDSGAKVGEVLKLLLEKVEGGDLENDRETLINFIKEECK